MSAYTEFLERKAQLAHAGGFEPTNLPGHLFDFQHALVEWAVRQGRAGLFADCGLGKTPMELAWAEQVYRHTGKPVLLMTPLAVGFQIVAEAEKFGHDAALSRTGKVTAPITVTNYEQLDKFEWSDFGGVVCDESSAIKSFEGTRRATVTEFMRRIQYRLLGTATAAPNDSGTMPARNRFPPSCTVTAAGMVTRSSTGTPTGFGDATPPACGTTSGSIGCCRSATPKTRTTRSTSTPCNSM